MVQYNKGGGGAWCYSITRGGGVKFRVVILKKKKCCTLHVVPNCCRTPIQKFHVLMLPLSFENLDCYHKISESPQKNC